MKKISDSTVRRMSQYYRSLNRLIDNGVDTISSEKLAHIENITSAQVRKDLSFFGSFGKRGLGYNTLKLKDQIGEILGLDKKWHVGLVGAGNIGRALTDYNEFKKQGFFIDVVFDADPAKIGTQCNNIPILSVAEADKYSHKNKLDIMIIAVPASAAQQVCNTFMDLGVKAFLNFAPISLQVKDDVVVKNENMSVEIESLSFFLHNKNGND
jgi:redox-sensing transcriptional repressor